MDNNRILLVVCLTILAVGVVNLAILAVGRRGRGQSDGQQIDLLRRAAQATRQPWQDEDKALKELAQRVAKLKEEKTDKERP